MKHTLFALLPLLGSIPACSPRPHGTPITPTEAPVPDYADPDNWAALPFKKDPADSLPAPDLEDRQTQSPVDVFFLHPTTYTGRKGQKHWNAPLDDAFTNARTDRTTILHQASIFNAAGRVFAPRYRQAHLHIFYDRKEDRKKLGARAFQLAYQDVRRAFQHYLEAWNDGRPILIAAHSQGTGHAIRLLKEFFDGKPLQQRLVAAYLVGWPVPANTFQNIPPCQTPEQTGCFCSWRTFKRGYLPKRHYTPGNEVVVTNPLTWTTDTTYAPQTLNRGSVLRSFQLLRPGLVDAQVHDGLLWTNKPRFKGSLFLWRKNYHVADLNLFWLNVRENARLRAESFIRNHPAR